MWPGLELGTQLGEFVFVVGPAVDGGRGLLVEQAHLGFEVGYLLLRIEQSSLCLFECWKVGGPAAVGAAVLGV